MYTNPSNIVKTLIGLLERNRNVIDEIIHVYKEDRTLNVFEGMRRTLPVDAYPSLEIESTNAANEWATTRSQRPRFSFQLTLTTKTSNVNLGMEYVCSLATVIAAILTDPTSLHLPIINESKFDPNAGLIKSYIIDSFCDDVTYNANQEGTIRVAEFNYWATVHEPYAESKWLGGDSTQVIVEDEPRTIDVP